WKFLGTLAILLAFVALLGLAFRTFNESALLAAVAIGLFVYGIKPLLELLSELDEDQVWNLIRGLGALAAFVFFLGEGMKKFSWESFIAVAAIFLFVKAITPMVELLSKLDREHVWTLAIGLGALAGFVFLLGKAFEKLSWKSFIAVAAVWL